MEIKKYTAVLSFEAKGEDAVKSLDEFRMTLFRHRGERAKTIDESFDLHTMVEVISLMTRTTLSKTVSEPTPYATFTLVTSYEIPDELLKWAQVVRDFAPSCVAAAIEHENAGKGTRTGKIYPGWAVRDVTS